MRKIEIISIEINNFRCFEHKEIELNGKSSTISGHNGAGKSTIYNALLWILFDKNQDGTSATNVRPHDKDGNDIDDVEISVACRFLVDNREIELKKTQIKKFTKNRITGETSFTGNESRFFVNDIPKQPKEFKAYISENFCDEDTFLMCTSASSFYKLDTKKRRAKLLSMVGEIEDAQVVSTNEMFKSLENDLRDGTIEELITRSKKKIKELNEELKAFPIRIDEMSKQKVDVDVAELELQKSDIHKRIAETEETISNIKSEINCMSEKSAKCLEIKFEMSDIERKAKEEAGKGKTDLFNESLALENKKITVERELLLAGKKVNLNEIDIAELEKKLQGFNKDLERCYDAKFDASTIICPTCGREFDEERRAELFAKFEIEKQEDIDRAKENISVTEESIKYVSENKEQWEKTCEEYKKQLLEISEQLKKVEKKLSCADHVNVVLPDVYYELEKELKENESALSEIESKQATLNELKMKKNDLFSQLVTVDSKIAASNRNIDIDERIEQLRIGQRAVAQKIADQEKQLYILDEFNKSKMQLLTDVVNKHFNRIKWVLFEKQINGNYADVCYATVDGSNRERGLNDSDGLIADIELLETFQKLNSLQIPVFLDRAESIETKRIPKTDCQLIELRVSDGQLSVIKE